jgi:hypothetical protein
MKKRLTVVAVAVVSLMFALFVPLSRVEAKLVAIPLDDGRYMINERSEQTLAVLDALPAELPPEARQGILSEQIVRRYQYRNDPMVVKGAEKRQLIKICPPIIRISNPLWKIWLTDGQQWQAEPIPPYTEDKIDYFFLVFMILAVVGIAGFNVWSKLDRKVWVLNGGIMVMVFFVSVIVARIVSMDIRQVVSLAILVIILIILLKITETFKTVFILACAFGSIPVLMRGYIIDPAIMWHYPMFFLGVQLTSLLLRFGGRAVYARLHPAHVQQQ